MQGDGETSGGVGTRILADLLTWMQEKTAPVVIVATANSIRGLSSALLRKGRFDEIFFVDLPGPKALKEILRIHLAKRKRNPEKFLLDFLVPNAIGMSGAEIESAVEDAMFTAFSQGRDITTADLETSIRNVIPYSVMQQEEAQSLRKWATRNARAASTETVDLQEVVALRKQWGRSSQLESRISTVTKGASKPR